ncbi:Protein sprint [Chionoecetes opilio]|uniref:Protein sprint n=1 Tax=Chionoecetes opilio TaxID=41210 RepID=A0A8J4YQ78_CHIOP|nr:Protein sprint [Chionoecetes opilio]
MASPTTSTPTAESLHNNAPTPSPRPLDLSFSSFGKGGVTRGTSSISLLSPQTLAGVCTSGKSMGSSAGGSTSPLTPVRPAPPLPSPGDRSSLNLNLAPLEEFLKEQPTFTSFRSQLATPVSQLKPSTPGTKPVPPPRSSPPGVQRISQISPLSSQRLLSKPVPAARFSPPIGSEIGTPTSENGEIVYRQNQAPAPPPRWARPWLITSPSNITVTTTLTLNVNQVKALPLQVDESQEGMTVHIANLEISPSNNSNSSLNVQTTTHNGNQSGTLNGYRDGLHLQIRQQITSPQSTPCTPCGPSTPVGEEGISRVRMRNGKRDKRRHSNHYHEANIIDSNALYCRSSVVDKMSDYEDLWSSPPREMPSTQNSSQPKMSTFKPRNEISKSMGDLSEIAKNSKSTTFTYNTETIEGDESTSNNDKNGNGNSTDSVSSYRKNSSPFYMEPADALKELQSQAKMNKASNALPKKVNNRYSDSNIQWKTRKKHNSLGIIDSNEDLPSASNTENLANGRANEISNIKTEEETNRNIETEYNKVNARYLANGQGRNAVRRHSKIGGRRKPIALPRIGIDSHTSNGDQSADVGCHLASSWEYHLHGSDTEDMQGGESRFPVDDNGESDSVIIPGERTVQDLISEKHPDLVPSDVHSIAPSSITRISEYDNVGSHGANIRGEDQHQKAPNRKISRSILPEERIHPPLPTHYFPSTISDSGTEFSEPWDSRKWEPFMQSEDDSSVDHYPRSMTATPALCTSTLEDSDIGGAGVTDTDSFVHVTGGENIAVSDGEEAGSISGTPTLSLAHGHNLDTQQRSRIMSPQLLALRHRQDAENGEAIRAYAVDLGNDTSTTFNQAVNYFITCTLESPEKDPAIVTRNVRQFMSGMKNYLLKATEFLNLDAILEDVLVRLVLRPLWNHINKLFVDAYSANGSIQQLANNMKYAHSQQYIRLGIKVSYSDLFHNLITFSENICACTCPVHTSGQCSRAQTSSLPVDGLTACARGQTSKMPVMAELSPPSGVSLDTIRCLLTRMQKVYAPREKLESLLATISHIYQALQRTLQNFNFAPLRTTCVISCCANSPPSAIVILISFFLAADVPKELCFVGDLKDIC